MHDHRTQLSEKDAFQVLDQIKGMVRTCIRWNGSVKMITNCMFQMLKRSAQRQCMSIHFFQRSLVNVVLQACMQQLSIALLCHDVELLTYLYLTMLFLLMLLFYLLVTYSCSSIMSGSAQRLEESWMW